MAEPLKDAKNITKEERAQIMKEVFAATAPHIKSFQQATKDYDDAQAAYSAASEKAYQEFEKKNPIRGIDGKREGFPESPDDTAVRQAQKVYTEARAPVEAAVKKVLAAHGLSHETTDLEKLAGIRDKQKLNAVNHNYNLSEYLIHRSANQDLREASTLTAEENARLYTQVLAAAGPDKIKALQQAQKNFAEWEKNNPISGANLQNQQQWNEDRQRQADLVKAAEKPVYEAARSVFAKNKVDPGLSIAPADAKGEGWDTGHYNYPAKNEIVLHRMVQAMVNPPSQQQKDMSSKNPTMTPADAVPKRTMDGPQ